MATEVTKRNIIHVLEHRHEIEVHRASKFRPNSLGRITHMNRATALRETLEAIGWWERKYEW